MTQADYEDIIEKFNRMHQAFSVVGNLVLPLEDEERVLDIITEQLIRATRIRSLVLAIVYENRGYVQEVRVGRFNKLSATGRLTELSTPQILRLPGEQTSLQDPISMMARTVREERVIIVDGNDHRLRSQPNYEPNKWEGKVAYFLRYQHNSDPIMVLAGACPLEDAEIALEWTEYMAPLIELVTTQIRTLRVLKEQRFMAYQPPSEVQLSDREKEVLRRVAIGESSNIIADAMNLSPRTVHTYRRRICTKLDRYSQADLTRYAIISGLIPLTDR